MSYSFSVPVGPVAQFSDRAETAYTEYVAHLNAQDVQLEAATVTQIENTLSSAADLVSKLTGSDVYVGASLSGHVNPSNAAGTTCNLSLFTSNAPAPTPAEPAVGQISNPIETTPVAA